MANIQPNATQMLLGLTGDKGEKSHSVLALTKHYIHVSKCTENAKSTVGLWRHIRHNVNIEKTIATSKNTLSEHKKKWDKFAYS